MSFRSIILFLVHAGINNSSTVSGAMLIYTHRGLGLKSLI